MRKPIEGKHLGGVECIDMQTGERTPSTAKLMLMPAPEGTCEVCAVKHDPKFPHNASSMFYQYNFFNEYGRWPDWRDAMSHCDNDMKEYWTLRLEENGIEIEKGQIKPKKRNQ